MNPEYSLGDLLILVLSAVCFDREKSVRCDCATENSVMLNKLLIVKHLQFLFYFNTK